MKRIPSLLYFSSTETIERLTIIALTEMHRKVLQLSRGKNRIFLLIEPNQAIDTISRQCIARMVKEGFVMTRCDAIVDITVTFIILQLRHEDHHRLLPDRSHTMTHKLVSARITCENHGNFDHDFIGHFDNFNKI